jgi:hypothetical protein
MGLETAYHPAPRTFDGPAYALAGVSLCSAGLAAMLPSI